jgi:hypothetical protein
LRNKERNKEEDMSDHNSTMTIATLLFTVSLLGCRSTADSPRTQQIDCPPQASVKGHNPAALSNPVKVAVFLDKTGSWSQTQAEGLTVADLDPIFGLLRQVGGEVAIGLISDRSDRGLIRLRLERPTLVAPPCPDRRGNPYEVAVRVKKYEETAKKFAADQAAWEAKADQKIKAFVEEVQPLIAQLANSRRSDVNGALQRGEAFLSEPDSWGTRYLVLLSDCKDNVGAARPAIASKLIVTNGLASVPLLEDLKPVRFESVRAAILWIVAQSGEKGVNTNAN